MDIEDIDIDSIEGDEEETEVVEDIPKIKANGRHFKAWKVFLDGKLFDTVNYSNEMDIKQVRRALITVDGYPREIEVIEE